MRFGKIFFKKNAFSGAKLNFIAPKMLLHSTVQHIVPCCKKFFSKKSNFLKHLCVIFAVQYLAKHSTLNS
ncbi:hypothetical protein C7N43_27610 [Sphingobacteriales bacterium UPWRP_1]|nr:hypothetical protein BVG80_09135 [Sphingobacteriales bacterium TSM_CSM]PSJ73735.1 hypothetical protein C7N43_27610 [Sphingobacteriales bacterium UPWRP_1]